MATVDVNGFLIADTDLNVIRVPANNYFEYNLSLAMFEDGKIYAKVFEGTGKVYIDGVLYTTTSTSWVLLYPFEDEPNKEHLKTLENIIFGVVEINGKELNNNVIDFNK